MMILYHFFLILTYLCLVANSFLTCHCNKIVLNLSYRPRLYGKPGTLPFLTYLHCLTSVYTISKQHNTYSIAGSCHSFRTTRRDFEAEYSLVTRFSFFRLRQVLVQTLTAFVLLPALFATAMIY
ncbi:hypothetical protein F4810DRAFT_661919 [Camillea tinctor]|nr:hypothetical protein F4810DRAFT_661919 [Camillea tinctor]